MNILVLAQSYYPILGGVETQTRLIVQELSKHHHVEVAATSFEGANVPHRLRMLTDSLLLPSYANFVDEGVQVHALTPTWTERLRMTPIALRALPRLQRYYYHELKAFGYRWFKSVYAPKLRALMQDVDVVHCVAGNYLGWLGQEIAEELNIPFVWTPYVHPGQHGDDDTSVRHYRRADAILALLETDREMLVDLGVPRDLIHLYGVVPLLPDSTDPEAFRTRHGLGTSPIVLFVGRMVEYKGVPTILKAAESVWDTHPDTQFLFAGSADEEVAAQFEQMDARIHYLGRVSEQEKADALATCTVFCMPSKYEILPAVYLEAWSYGKPVVAGPAHGLDALVEANGGGIVTDQTPDAVARTLTFLLDNPEQRSAMGQRGQQLVKDRYSTEALVQILNDVYAACRRDNTRASSPGCPDQKRNGKSLVSA
jgi:glycosyltransferase involved in cell wall biosynthesis